LTKEIKVLIVDDSALVRQMLTTILRSDPGIDVVGAAEDALEAREMIKRLNPDVVTLDIEMPKMNGLEFLKKIMKLRPMPVVMVSTLTQNGAETTLKALEIGAVDFVAKPQQGCETGLQEKAQEIVTKVKIASRAKIRPHDSVQEANQLKRAIQPLQQSRYKMIVIGASTGGVEALRNVISGLPKNMPPIFIVQHMPKQFTKTFAARLNGLSELVVSEAEDYMLAKHGHVYVAPGDKHLRIAVAKGELVCRLVEGNPVSGHIPSVDVLFDSACHIAPKETIGVMLSGMGRDGSESMAKLKLAGAYNIGQDETSCVVYGMPKAAYERGAIDKQADVNKIADVLISLCEGNGDRSA